MVISVDTVCDGFKRWIPDSCACWAKNYKYILDGKREKAATFIEVIREGIGMFKECKLMPEETKCVAHMGGKVVLGQQGNRERKR